MSLLPNVVIILSRCSRSRQQFGMRFEEYARGHWQCDCRGFEWRQSCAHVEAVRAWVQRAQARQPRKQVAL